MVFQVYLAGETPYDRHTVVDIEYWLDQSSYTKKWRSKIVTTNIVDGIARFVELKVKENPNYNVLQFITDTNSLRISDWLFNQPDNLPTENVRDISPSHHKRIDFIRQMVYDYANKYGLEVNED